MRIFPAAISPDNHFIGHSNSLRYFCRENGGFDAFVGNPPFLGGQMISGVFGSSYHHYLVNWLTYDGQSSVDLMVYFFPARVLTVCCAKEHYMGLLGRRSISEAKNREAG